MFYKKHIFFCCNQKTMNKGCGNLGGEAGFMFAKSYLKSLLLWGKGEYRASKSGCLGRCTDASVCVIYPDGVWYTYANENDIKQIIDEHIVNNHIVKHLQI